MLYERIVVKLGTSVLTGGTPYLHKPTMVELARQCAALHASGRDIVICSSGAIGAGRERLDFPSLPQTLASKQLLAAVGQSRLMHLWERYFEIYGLHVGQILLTRADAENRQRYLNARDTLLAMIEHGIVPIINENDAVSVDEIRVGDNDNLSAIVATLSGADLLLLLTDQKGLFTADPRNDPRAQQLRVIEDIDDDVLALAGGSVSGLGVGGMTTKLQAAQVARRAGADVVIAAGKEPDIITRIVAGEAAGTRIPALDQTLDSRKQWILAGQTPSGAIVIDDGARKALSSNGSSLLPAGISRIEGRFQRGDTVSVLDRAAREFARGMTRYDSGDLARIAGAHSDAIEDILGYGYGPVAIHRNDLILM